LTTGSQLFTNPDELSCFQAFRKDPVLGRKFIIADSDPRTQVGSLIFTAFASGGTTVNWVTALTSPILSALGISGKTVATHCRIPKSCIAGYLEPAYLNRGLTQAEIADQRKAHPIFGEVMPSVFAGVSPLVAGMHPRATGSAYALTMTYLWESMKQAQTNEPYTAADYQYHHPQGSIDVHYDFFVVSVQR
jgi:hypothetical protein